MVQKFREIRLSTKLTFAFTAIVLFVAGILTFAMFVQLSHAQRNLARERLRDIVSFAAPQIDGDFHTLIVSPDDAKSSYYRIIKDNLEKIQQTSQAIKHMYTLRQQSDGSLVIIVDNGEKPDVFAAIGKKLDYQTPLLQAGLNNIRYPVVEEAFSLDETGNSLLYGYGPIFDQSGRMDGVLAIELDASVVIANEVRARNIALAVLLVTLPLVLLIGIGFVRYMTRPVEELVKGAEHIAQGQLEYRVPVRSRDELGILAATFNSMAESLQSRIAAEQHAQLELKQSHQQLEEYSQTLEQKVEQRTAQLSDAVKMAQEATVVAQEANRAKSQFLANMSHELRTPLNAIIGYSEMLQEDALDLDYTDIIPDLKKIYTAGRHLLDLINDILDLSKIEAGKMDLYLETIDVQSLIDNVVTTIQPIIEKNGNTLTIKNDSNIGTIYADHTKVRQILFNLLSNASKFTEKGPITLTVQRYWGAERLASNTEENPIHNELEWIMFRVTDSGIGMDSEQMKHLFKAFSQADASTTRKYGGTGLGLAITQRFCMMMGGDIQVESIAGQGTTFTVHIPAEVRPLSQDSGKQSLSTQPTPSLSHQISAIPPQIQGTVLVIDDDPVVCELISRWLVKDGLQIETVSNGMEGIRRAKELQPDVITLDVMMPGMDGWAVLAMIKSDPDIAHIPVIILTIVDEKEVGFALGANDYLLKPVDPQRLMSVVQLQKQKHRQHNEHFTGKVLIVEDDDATRDLLCRILQKDGWNIAKAENGRIALDYLKTNKPDLILLDLMMPEMDGFDVIAQLRSHAEWVDVPVIVITAMELTFEERLFLNGQVTQILQKAAYNREELLEEVHHQVLTCLRQKYCKPI